MRAIYLKEEFPSHKGTHQFQGEFFHHLVHVIRIRPGEKLLLLNGKGKKAHSTFKDVNQHTFSLEIESIEDSPIPKIPLKILIGLPKKDALYEMLRISVEMGVEAIYLYPSEYSNETLINEERIQKILISSLEQSNNPFLPQIMNITSLEALNMELNFIVFHPTDILLNQYSFEKNLQKNILCVGPEGGWSINEMEWFNKKASMVVALPTAILRAPTALAAGSGWYISKLDA